jgi:hypothetical protein
MDGWSLGQFAAFDVRRHLDVPSELRQYFVTRVDRLSACQQLALKVRTLRLDRAGAHHCDGLGRSNYGQAEGWQQALPPAPSYLALRYALSLVCWCSCTPRWGRLARRAPCSRCAASKSSGFRCCTQAIRWRATLAGCSAPLRAWSSWGCCENYRRCAGCPFARLRAWCLVPACLSAMKPVDLRPFIDLHLFIHRF